MKKLSNKINITIEALLLKNASTDQSISPLELFTPLANEPWAVWLDSCNSEHINSQFDILVWQPEITLSTFGELTHIEQKIMAKVGNVLLMKMMFRVIHYVSLKTQKMKIYYF